MNALKHLIECIVFDSNHYFDVFIDSKSPPFQCYPF